MVTETVWELLRHDPPWVPARIHIVTTKFKLELIRRKLQAADGPLGRLLGGMPPVAVHVPRRHSEEHCSLEPGQELPLPDDLLEDVGDQDEAARMGNLILRLLAAITADPHTELHMSLAGGRKTMSAHALMALSLVGRASDKTSHVLVSPAEYEGHPDFWYPGQGGRLQVRDGGEVDPAEARVALVPTPVPLMRNRVGKGEDLGRLDLLDLMRKANLAAALEQEPCVTLHVRDNTISAHGVPIKLSPKHFAVYRLLATARKEEWPGAGPDGVGAAHSGWLSLWQIAFADSEAGGIASLMLDYIRTAEAAALEDTQDSKSSSGIWKFDVMSERDADRLDKVKGNINPDIPRIQAAIRRKVGVDAARILMPQRGEKNEARFGLSIPARSVAIE